MATSFLTRRSLSIGFRVMRNSVLQTQSYASEMSFTCACPSEVFYNRRSVKRVDVPSYSAPFGSLSKYFHTLAVPKAGVVTVHEDDGSSKKFFGTHDLFPSKFLDPMNPVAFLRIFGTEKNKDILIGFLNAILDLTGKNLIQDVEFLSTTLDADIASKTESLVDVLCRDSTGVQFIVQMLVTDTKGSEKSAQYYAAEAYSRQAVKGDQYDDLKEIICIVISDCVLFPNKSEYISKHTIRDENTNEHNLKDFNFIFMELPKFPKNKGDQLENIIEKWAYFFRYAEETHEKELEKIIGSDVRIEKAYEELNRVNWSEKEFIAYEQEIKRILDNQAVLAQRLYDAAEELKREARIEGMIKGILEAKIIVGKALLADNVDVDTIVKCTGLSLSTIKELQKV